MRSLLARLALVAVLARFSWAEEPEIVPLEAKKSPPPNSQEAGELPSRSKEFMAALKAAGGSEETEGAVLAGLKWLARHQSPGGNWTAEKFDQRCVGKGCACTSSKSPDAALTGLALLAFLGAGQTHLTKWTYIDNVDGRTVCFGEVTKNAIKWLISNQDAEGCFGGRHEDRYVLSHALATLAMNEAYRLTRSALFKDSAQRAVDFLAVSQNKDLGWRYTKLCGENDSFVTAWCALALWQGKVSGLTVPQSTFNGAETWFGEATDAKTRRVGYDKRASAKNVEKGKNEDWDDHETLTAAATAARIFLGADKLETAVVEGAKLVAADLPAAEKKCRDACAWHFGALALWQFAGPGDPTWKKWNEALLKAVLPAQKKDGCTAGSWDPAEDRWGWAGGRIYVTAMNVLTLETSYRSERVWAKK